MSLGRRWPRQPSCNASLSGQEHVPLKWPVQLGRVHCRSNNKHMNTLMKLGSHYRKHYLGGLDKERYEWHGKCIMPKIIWLKLYLETIWGNIRRGSHYPGIVNYADFSARAKQDEWKGTYSRYLVVSLSLGNCMPRLGIVSGCTGRDEEIRCDRLSPLFQDVRPIVLQ